MNTTKMVEPLTMTIAGNTKQVVTIILSIYIFNTVISEFNMVGIFITLLGGAYYSYVAFDENEKSKIKKKKN